MKTKIIIVDDEQDILDLLKYNLEKEGYKCYTANNGLDALEISKEHKPSLMLLDIMMPGMDGIEVCKAIKENLELNTMFVLFLTARGEEYSEIAGFEVGADDYITKPIKLKVLISRIKAILKRELTIDSKLGTIELKNIKIDRSTYTVEISGKQAVFPKKEFELLYLLASKPGKIFTRESILSKVWGDDVVVVDRTIDVHIRKIREKIGDKKIKTVKGVGYKFEE